MGCQRVYPSVRSTADACRRLGRPSWTAAHAAYRAVDLHIRLFSLRCRTQPRYAERGARIAGGRRRAPADVVAGRRRTRIRTSRTRPRLRDLGHRNGHGTASRSDPRRPRYVLSGMAMGVLHQFAVGRRIDRPRPDVGRGISRPESVRLGLSGNRPLWHRSFQRRVGSDRCK